MSTALIAGIWAAGDRDSWRVNLFSGGNASILYKTKSDRILLTHDSHNVGGYGMSASRDRADIDQAAAEKAY